MIQLFIQNYDGDRSFNQNTVVLFYFDWVYFGKFGARQKWQNLNNSKIKPSSNMYFENNKTAQIYASMKMYLKIMCENMSAKIKPSYVMCILRTTNSANLCMHENVFKDHVLKYVRQN